MAERQLPTLDTRVRFPVKAPKFRDVAQSGSAPVWGTGGRWFKSSHPDHAAVAQWKSATLPTSIYGFDSRRRLQYSSFRSAVWSARLVWVQKVAGSNPAGKTLFGRVGVGVPRENHNLVFAGSIPAPVTILA